jgi:hypothetical protein
MAAVVIGYAIALMVGVAWFRGIWLDEIWSIWSSRHDLPLHQVFTDRWMRDVHPPLFHAVNWLLEPVTGLNIFAHRMENLGPLVVLLGCAVLLSLKYRNTSKFIAVFCVLLLTTKDIVVYFAEHRSYFLQAMLFSIVLMAMYVISVRRSDFDSRQDKTLAGVLAGSILLSLNAHYICTFVSGIVLGAFLVDQLRQRNWRWSAWIVASGLVAAVPLVSFYLVEASYFKSTAANLWIVTHTSAAVRMIAMTLGADAILNLVAAGAFAITIRRCFGGGKLQIDDGVPWSLVVAISAATLLALALLLAINLFQPIIVPRDLVAFAPMVSAVVAMVAAPVLWSRRFYFAAFALNAALSASVWAVWGARHEQWSQTAGRIAAQVRACPSTKVYALDPQFAPHYHGSPGEPEVHDWGYHLVGGYFGFPVQVIQAQDPLASPLAAQCPTVIWGEHMPMVRIADVTATTLISTLPSGELARAKTFKGRTGLILTLPPMGEPAPVRSSSAP